MLDISFGGAALAGLLSFLSPCILPMVPFYLSYMAGLSVKELRDGDTIAPGGAGGWWFRRLPSRSGSRRSSSFSASARRRWVAASPNGESRCPMSRAAS
jgi:cytochrome c biogenesis protein CcdA